MVQGTGGHEDISIHALREEGDTAAGRFALRNMIFQSTPSARRATSALERLEQSAVFQSTPSARRATANQ